MSFVKFANERGECVRTIGMEMLARPIEIYEDERNRIESILASIPFCQGNSRAFCGAIIFNRRMQRPCLEFRFAQNPTGRIARIRAACDDVDIFLHTGKARGFHRVGAHQQVVVKNGGGPKFLIRQAALMRCAIENNLGIMRVEKTESLIDRA